MSGHGKIETDVLHLTPFKFVDYDNIGCIDVSIHALIKKHLVCILESILNFFVQT